MAFNSQGIVLPKLNDIRINNGRAVWPTPQH